MAMRAHSSYNKLALSEAAMIYNEIMGVSKGSIVRQDAAKKEIFSVWHNWKNPEDKYGTHFGLFFYGWLQKNEQDLISFRCAGDKYQLINSWVMAWQREFPKIV